MTSSQVVLVVAVFLASSVEMVEALTIVVAAGVSRGWRSALEGVGAALLVLAVLVAALGPVLVKLPLNTLRTVIGGILLVYGLQWLRKAVLRATGYKAPHDEDVIYAKTVASMSQSAAEVRAGRDPVGFAVAFKGTLLEGLEVVIVVLTLGATDHDVGLAALAALVAVVLVGGVGVVVARQLANVPENTMKTAVGLMLVSFGSFWTGEGLGVHWPGSDLAIPVLVGIYGLVVGVLVITVRHSRIVGGVHAS
ncbi:MAG TPA: hypothetical protein VHU85_14665 [Acidimicrobiales bacterium]|nr:hypothetical protein [Acidimicrobiales bacterium]